jgi:hypothetical protein
MPREKRCYWLVVIISSRSNGMAPKKMNRSMYPLGCGEIQSMYGATKAGGDTSDHLPNLKI